MSKKYEMHEFTDPALLARELAGRVADLLAAAIKEKGRATLVVSGGSTPVPFFQALAQEDIAWQHVVITLADERWVPPDDPASNEGLVRRHLLRDKAQAARFVGLYTGAAQAALGEKECEKRITALGLPFDVLILGMGNDGHTASLFPGAANLQKATEMDSGRLCQTMTPLDAPHDRMTLTLPALLQAENIFLHITGSKKKQVLEKALAAGPPEEMPIRFILSEAASPVRIYWA